MSRAMVHQLLLLLLLSQVVNFCGQWSTPRAPKVLRHSDYWQVLGILAGQLQAFDGFGSYHLDIFCT